MHELVKYLGTRDSCVECGITRFFQAGAYAAVFFNDLGRGSMKTLKKMMSVLLALTMLAGCQKDKTVVSLAEAQQSYLSSIDTDYAYELALKLEENKTNEQLGYRTAGSEAEFLTGEMLKEEMEKIGLSNVQKDAFTLDGWTFEKAELSYATPEGQTKTIQLGGYHANFDTAGLKDMQLIDGKTGTEADLEGLDVEGKLVLIDINQRENWWINYPAYEAHLKGAAAVIACQDGGYAEISEDALNAQDICGPDDAPAFSITQRDAKQLRAIMQANDSNELTVQFDAKSTVERDVVSYNIVGMIPGQSAEMILMSAHYDSYFAGFQDDNAAIALMFGIAKGIIDSGYQPQKTLVFCAMAAEEWGMVNTRYDWSTGAYNEIFKVHPEWVGHVLADINFELPAMNEGTTDQIRSSYELATYLNTFKETVPTVAGIFEDGIEVIVPTQTWSDDFSLSIAGIPSTVTALRGDFAASTYHSQYDNQDTYSPEAFLFHHQLYGMLMLAYDHMAVSPLDFSTRLEALQSACESEALSTDQKRQLTAAIEEVYALAQTAYQKVEAVNQEYEEALQQSEAKASEVQAKYVHLNEQLLAAFKQAEDDFVRLTWEDVSIFPHEHSAGNIINLEAAITCLKNGQASEALDMYLWQIDNNWYAYDWSKNTYQYFTDYVLNQSADRLMWGAGRVQGHIDLFDVIRSLMVKGDQADYTLEIETLERALQQEVQLLENQVALELQGLANLKAHLVEINQ